MHLKIYKYQYVTSENSVNSVLEVLNMSVFWWRYRISKWGRSRSLRGKASYNFGAAWLQLLAALAKYHQKNWGYMRLAISEKLWILNTYEAMLWLALNLTSKT